jgi:signal transduction histidine kinase/ligand-binding sensor domain-containing protein/ActR/RegA family two-component response regulator
MRGSWIGKAEPHDLRVFALALTAFCLSLATPSWAAGRWDGLATTLLQPVAEDEELPNSAIPMAMETDAQGFLWVGTQNGLARWDGLHFRIYNTGDKPGALPDSQIDVVHRDRQGRLWIGTPSGGLARFDARTDSFSTLTPAKGGLSHIGVHALADAPAGGLWIGTERGLDLLTAAGGVEHVRGPRSDRTGVAEALASGISNLASHGPDLWIATHHGLLHRSGRTGDITRIRLGPGDPPQINAVAFGSDGRVWVGSEGHGAYAVDPDTLLARPAVFAHGQSDSDRGVRIRAVAEVKPGVVWLGTYDDGILAVDSKTMTVRPVHAGNGALLYADRNIRVLHRSPGGLVFIGANSAISSYDPRRTAFATLMGGEAPTAVLSERTPISVFEAADHRIWVGFTSHGLDRIDPETNRIDHILPSPGGLPKAAIRSYAALADGNVLLGTDLGLYRVRADGTGAQRLMQPGRAPDARVQSVQRAGTRIWVSGRDGLWGYRLGAGDRVESDIHLSTDSLSDQRIEASFLDRNGDLWIGTDNGLNRLNARTGGVERFVVAPGDSASPRGFISSIMRDSRDRLWVTTFGRGLSVAEPAAPGQPLRFHRIDVANGLPNSNVNKVIEDRLGYLWASTDSGLVRIDPKTFHLDLYRAPEGVPVSSFFYSAGTRTSSDELLFAGRGGLVLVHPDRIKPVVTATPLVVTSVRTRGHTVQGNPFLGLGPDDALQVEAGAGSLDVSFAALDYAAPDRVRYGYRLVAANAPGSTDEPWIETDATRPVASFTNLAPGAYRLEIRAMDPTGAWKTQTLSLPIRMLPAWFQTWWFTTIEVALGLGAIGFLVWWRTGALVRHRRELEGMVDERTQALQVQTKALEAQAVTLAQTTARAEALAKAKSDFLANMSHEIRTPLNGVVAVAELLARSKLGAKEREMAEIIRSSGDTLQRLLSDILDSARIESGKIAIETAPFHAGAMIRAVAGLSQLKCDEKGIKLVVDISADIDQFVMGDLVRVRQVLTNLISNAVKFTDKGEVRITAHRTAEGLARLTVSDTGVGFAAADKAKVLGRFEQADSSIARRYGGSGLGLSICCDLASLMGGTLDCESSPGVGSHFWLELPLEPTAAAAVPDDVTLAAPSANGADRPPRILLADDHPTNRKVVELMLEETDAELISVENGLEAVDAFRADRFDAILMDMQMPVMDGLTAIRQIRAIELAERSSPTPIIMLTANALPEHVAGALAAGADLHLAKPLTAASLFQALTEAMALHAAAQQVA